MNTSSVRFWSALSALFAIGVSTANATVYVRDGFDVSAYAVDSTSNYGKLHGKGGATAGFSDSAKWNCNDSSAVRCLADGLSFPSSWDGYVASGSGSIGYNDGGDSTAGSPGNDSHYRAAQRKLNENALPSSGTFYFRTLIRQEKGAGTATQIAGGVRGIGFRTSALNIGNYGRTESGGALSNGVWIATRKTSNSKTAVDTEIVLSAGGELQTLVSAAYFSEDTTYICVAEVSIDDEKTVCRAFAMPVDSYDRNPAQHWSESVETTTVNAGTPLTHLCMTGPYRLQYKKVQFDEIAAASDVADLVPTATTDFIVYPELAGLSVGHYGFSVPVAVTAQSGVTAVVSVEYGMSAETLDASVDVISGLEPGASQTATVGGLEPDATYYWRLRAKAEGYEDAVSAVQSLHTTGAPSLSDATASVDGNAVVFSVRLSEPALYGGDDALLTEVTVCYTVDGAEQSRSLGSASEPHAFTGRVDGIAWGKKCGYRFTATADKGSRTLSAATQPQSIEVLFTGDVYVSPAGSATAPYDTPAKAASDIASAVSVSGDGCTVHVAKGEYSTSDRIVLSRAIRVEGETGRAPDVVVRNVGSSSTSRVFNLTNPGAVLANVTVTDGHIVNYTGGNIWMTAGLVTNCVIQNANQAWDYNNTTDEHGGAGIYMRGGRMVNCIVRNNRVSGMQLTNLSTGVLMKGENGSPAVAMGCLFEANDSDLESSVVLMGEYAHLVGCTIVKTTLGAGAATSSIRLASTTAYVQNCVAAGVADANGGTVKVYPGDRFDNIAYSAFDFEFDDAYRTAKHWVSGTAAAFFTGYGRGSYNPGEVLRNAGKSDILDKEAMPSVDLAGSPRLVGDTYDIGCFEWHGRRPFVVVVR